MIANILTAPKLAIFVVTLLFGRLDLYDDLVDICNRESRCSQVSEHEIDKHISKREWYGQTQLGHLDPSCQYKKSGWATRGAWGLSSGAHWKYVPNCYKPKRFDSSYISAIIATRKYIINCWSKNNKRRWCKVNNSSYKNNAKVSSKFALEIKKPNNWFDFFIGLGINNNV